MVAYAQIGAWQTEGWKHLGVSYGYCYNNTLIRKETYRLEPNDKAT
jgi:hypothetical protein